MLIPLAFAYGFLRHQTLEVRGVFRRSLVYASTAVVLASVYAFLAVEVYELLVPSTGGMQHTIWFAVAAVALGMSFPPIHARVRKAIDKYVYADSFELNPAVLSVTRVIATTHDLSTLAESTIGILRKLMNVPRATIWVARNDHNWTALRASGDRGSNGSECSPIRPEALIEGQDVSVVNNEMVVRLVSRDRCVGIVTVAPKLSGEPFGAPDFQLVRTIAGPLGVAVENGMLLEQLREQVRSLEISNEEIRCARKQLEILNSRILSAQEDERRRVLTDIHDAPLARVMMLQRDISGAVGDLSDR